MNARQLLPWCALTACQAPLSFSFDVPADVQSLLLVSDTPEGPSIDAFHSGDPVFFTLLSGASSFWALGYRTPLERMGLTSGPVPVYTSADPSQSLPMAARSWVRDGASMRALEWSEVDPRVRALRIGFTSAEACFAPGGCYLDEVERFCVECPVQDAPTPPTRPAPARLPPCELATDELSFDCLFRGRALELPTNCSGRALASGCQTEVCARHLEANADTIWVLPAADVPTGAATAPSLDAALSLITPGGLVVLGAGTYTASVAVPDGVQLSGLCAGVTMLSGALRTVTATLTDLRWSDPGEIPLGSNVAVREAAIGGAELTIGGALVGRRLDVDAGIVVLGSLVLEGAAIAEALSLRGGTFEGLDLRFMADANLTISDDGRAELSRARFEPRLQMTDRAVTITDGTLRAERSVFLGTIEVSTAPNVDGHLQLTDTLVSTVDRQGAYGILADAGPVGFKNVESGPCPESLLATIELERLTFTSTEYMTSPAPPDADAIRVNCSSLVAKDVIVNGNTGGAGIHLGALGNLLGGPSVERAMVTSSGFIDRAHAAEVRDHLNPPQPGAGIRLSQPPSSSDRPEDFTLELTDISAFGRKRGFYVAQGRQRLAVERIQVIGSYGNAMIFEKFVGEVRIRDLEIDLATASGNDSVLFGHGFVACSVLSGHEGTYEFDRFSIHDVSGAALFLEGQLGPLSFTHGTIANNGIGLLDAVGRERQNLSLTGVRFEGNDVTVQSD